MAKKFVFINLGRKITRGNVWGIVNSATPPLGLALLAAVLERAGHQADIIDAAALRLEDGQILAEISVAPDFIGLAATTPEINNVVRFAAVLRRAFPQSRILFGGVHPTVFHRSLVEDGSCDLVIRNEGEDAVVELADGCSHEAIRGLTWRDEDGNVRVNPDRDSFVDLDSLPFPAFDKLPMHAYYSAVGAAIHQPSLGIITSRGCPGSCTFCYSAMFGHKTRFMSAENTVRLIEHLYRDYGIREISFYDDTFTADRKRVAQICELLEKKNLRISWSCFARVDTVNQQLLHQMRAAGCHQIMYGFESADAAVLKAINKKTGPEQAKSAVSMTRQAGINVRGAFMLGSPGDSHDLMRSTIAFSQQLDIQLAIFNITTPFPGTALFKWAEAEGCLKHREWELYDLAHAVMEIPGLPAALVEECYRQAFRSFYLRWSYICKRLLARRTVDERKIMFRAVTRIISRMLAGS